MFANSSAFITLIMFELIPLFHFILQVCLFGQYAFLHIHLKFYDILIWFSVKCWK